jgi:hypothetical protein
MGDPLVNSLTINPSPHISAMPRELAQFKIREGMRGARSVVGSLATEHMQFLEDDLLGDAFDLDEDVIEGDLSEVVLEVVLLRPAVVRPQDVNLGVLTQSLHRVPVLRVEIAEVLE